MRGRARGAFLQQELRLGKAPWQAGRVSSRDAAQRAAKGEAGGAAEGLAAEDFPFHFKGTRSHRQVSDKEEHAQICV